MERGVGGEMERKGKNMRGKRGREGGGTVVCGDWGGGKEGGYEGTDRS